jgi:beta-lactamase regulating signal transducer with metallopeptidase domain
MRSDEPDIAFTVAAVPGPAPRIGLGHDLEPQTAAPPTAGAATATVLPWRECLLGIWLAGSLLWFGRTALCVVRFRRLLRAARPAPAGLQEEADALARRLGLWQCPRIWLLPGAVSPMVWALASAPRLLFPTGLLDRLDPEQRACLLLHELAHVRRRDHWLRLAELIVLGLYWWHPIAWWARRRLREAEEQCCDAWVVWALAGAGRPYALALLQAVAFVSGARLSLPAGASGIGHVSHLRRRLIMIMRGDTPRCLSAAGWLAVFGLGLFLLPLSARAQTPDKKGENPRDQQIQQLKKALRALEEQKRADGAGKADKGKSSPEVEKAMAAAAELKQQIAAKRAELDQLEAKLQKVLAGLNKAGAGSKNVLRIEIKDLQGLKELDRLKELKDLKQLEELKALGQDGEAIKKKVLEEIKKSVGPDGEQIREKVLQELKRADEATDMALKKAMEQLKQSGALNDKAAARAVEQLKRARGLKDAASSPKKDTKLKDKKEADVEMRLQKLMDEVQQLRKEIREERQKRQSQ